VKAPSTNPHAPFCSARCKLIDLGQWIDEGYRIDQDAPAVRPLKPVAQEPTK